MGLEVDESYSPVPPTRLKFEDRFILPGMSSRSRVHVVVHCDRKFFIMIELSRKRSLTRITLAGMHSW